MEVSAESILSKQFETRMRGFDREEVLRFQREVAQAFDDVDKSERLLRKKNKELERELEESREREESLRESLMAAQQLAEQMREKAQKDAKYALDEAAAKAREIRESARKEAAEDLDAAKIETQRLLQEAAGSAERILQGARIRITAIEEEMAGLRKKRADFVAKSKALLAEQLEFLNGAYPESVPETITEMHTEVEYNGRTSNGNATLKEHSSSEDLKSEEKENADFTFTDL